MKKFIVLICVLFSLNLFSQEVYTTRKNNKPFVAEYSISQGGTKMTINGTIYDFRRDNDCPINIVSGWIFRTSTKQPASYKVKGTWYRIVIEFENAAKKVTITNGSKILETFDNED